MNKTALIGLANEIDGEGWLKLSTYGDSLKTRITKTATGEEHAEAFLQRLDRPTAEKLSTGFNSLWGKFRRAISAVPVYEGHPDLTSIDPSQVGNPGADNSAPVGSINRLEARDDGLYAQIGLFPKGQALANEGRKWISPFWWVEESTRQDKPGVTIVHPYQLISGGLTDKPNIKSGQPLANEHPQLQQIMKQLLIGLLAARGIALANDAPETDILGKTAGIITSLEGEVTTLKGERTALANEKTALTAERDAVKTALTTAEQTAAAARTALANERTAHAEALVDLAIAQGKVAVADRATRIATLTGATTPEAFAAARTALANEAVKHKVDPTTTGARRNGAVGNPRERLIALENSDPYRGIADYSARFNAILRDHPDLKAALDAPLPTN